MSASRITIVGAGRVGRALGRAWIATGHQITFGVRDPDSDKSHAALKECGREARVARVEDSSSGADFVVLATPWIETEQAVRALGSLTHKIIIDATNPIIIGADEANRGLLIGLNTSAAEEIARWASGARVVKAFNTTGTGNLQNPSYGNQRIPGFVCGDDPVAKELVMKLVAEVGLRPIDVGALRVSRLLEPMALLWISLAYGAAWGPDFAFDIIKRPSSAR